MVFELHEGKQAASDADARRWGEFSLVGTFPTPQEAQLESFRIWDRSHDQGMPACRKRIWDDDTAHAAFPPAAGVNRFIIRRAPA
jgi:hypothetical protein